MSKKGTKTNNKSKKEVTIKKDIDDKNTKEVVNKDKKTKASGKNKNTASKEIKSNVKEVKSKKDLDKTQEFTTRIRIDRSRLNDTGTLDTSFLGKQENVNKRKILVNEEQMRKDEEKRMKKENKGSFFKDFILLILCIGTLVLSFCIVDKYTDNSCKKEKTKVKTKTETVEVDKFVLDDNYLFLGDFLTDDYDLEEYFKDTFVVKSANRDDKVTDFLRELEDRVYKYNPSDVFIEIGLNDVLDDKDEEEVVTKITEIVDRIKENRSYAKVYVESIYPVNREMDDDLLENANEKSTKINEKLRSMAEEKDVTYIDIYDLLADKDGNLSEEYTDDGKSLNEDAYKLITDEIKKYMEEDE